MKKWEYQFIVFKNSTEPDIEQINKLGKVGWRIVPSTYPGPGVAGGVQGVFMERERIDQSIPR